VAGIDGSEVGGLQVGGAFAQAIGAVVAGGDRRQAVAAQPGERAVVAVEDQAAGRQGRPQRVQVGVAVGLERDLRAQRDGRHGPADARGEQGDALEQGAARIDGFLRGLGHQLPWSNAWTSLPAAYSIRSRERMLSARAAATALSAWNSSLNAFRRSRRLRRPILNCSRYVSASSFARTTC